jgi:hypothetical protein
MHLSIRASRVRCSSSAHPSLVISCIIPGRPYWEYLGGSVPAHWGSHENYLAESQIQSLRMSGPLDGVLGSADC